MVSINHRLKDQWENAKAEAGCAWSAVQNLPESALSAVDDRPLAMTFAAFGIGIGVGVALGMALQEMTRETPKPAESFTRQAFQAMSHALPEAWSRQMQQFQR
jgi:hypothetical protein